MKGGSRKKRVKSKSVDEKKLDRLYALQEQKIIDKTLATSNYEQDVHDDLEEQALAKLKLKHSRRREINRNKKLIRDTKQIQHDYAPRKNIYSMDQVLVSLIGAEFKSHPHTHGFNPHYDGDHLKVRSRRKSSPSRHRSRSRKRSSPSRHRSRSRKRSSPSRHRSRSRKRSSSKHRSRSRHSSPRKHRLSSSKRRYNAHKNHKYCVRLCSGKRCKMIHMEGTKGVVA